MAGKEVHLLLVEDDEIDAESIERAFKKNKIANPLHRARDGVEALELLRGDGEREPLPSPHLLIIDLNMPRMNGIELLKEIREDESLSKTIAFVLTTSKREEDKLKAYDFNIAGYLIKSHFNDDFLEVIRLIDHYWKIVEFP